MADKQTNLWSKMSKHTIFSVALMGTVLILAFVLNPTPSRHRTKIKEDITERSPIAGAIGLGSLTAFASTYHSLGVASYTTSGDRTLSIGAFGMVFVSQ